MNDFEKVLDGAIKKCDGYIGSGYSMFHVIYPYTTENISGYVDMFDYENKTTLTVGSSADQVLSMGLKGALQVDVIDVCPYTKFYFYLKKAAIMTLDYNAFLEFFCYDNYPRTFKKNKKVFNKQSYNKIKDTLRLLDYESFLFWDELFNLYDPIRIRDYLFSNDEDQLRVITKIVPYLDNENVYNRFRKDVIKIVPNFITADIFEYDFNKKYDNVVLSNICKYYGIRGLRSLMDKLSNYLNKDAKVLFAYLYQTKRNTVYNSDWEEIYDLDKTFNILGDYISSYEEIIGVSGIRFKDDETKDMLLIYNKK